MIQAPLILALNEQQRFLYHAQLQSTPKMSCIETSVANMKVSNIENLTRI